MNEPNDAVYAPSLSDDDKLLMLSIEELDARSQTKMVGRAAVLIIDENNVKFWMEQALPKIKGWFKRLEERRKYLKAPLLEAERRTDGLFKPTLLLLSTIEARVKSAFVEYRRTVAAEQARIDAEAQRSLTEQRTEQSLNVAAQLEAQGRPEDAARIITEAISTPAPPVTTAAPQMPKFAGVSTSLKWRFRIVDADAIPRDFLMPDTDKIQSIVETFQKKAEGTIPGIEVYSEEIVSSRAAISRER